VTCLAILGASGHGKVVAEVALLVGWSRILFYDDAWPKREWLGEWHIAGTTADLLRRRGGNEAAIVAIGDNRTRLARYRQLLAGGANVVTLVHPTAAVSPRAVIGAGTVICAGAVIGPDALVGAACIINTAATVDHDCVLGDGVHVSPGAHLGGTVRIGDTSWIGIGSVVRQGAVISANVVVGAGAAVVTDIAPGLTVVGVPARPLQSSK
jgi:sugar O-acyltransferase (sialic acid O-acetyltransferase NeuD family)